MNNNEENGNYNTKRPTVPDKEDIDMELGNLNNERNQTYSNKSIQSSYNTKDDYEIAKSFQAKQGQASSGNKSHDDAFDLRTAADKNENFEFGNSDSQTTNIGNFKGFGDPKEDMELGDLMERGRKQHVFTAGKNNEKPGNDYNNQYK